MDPGNPGQRRRFLGRLLFHGARSAETPQRADGPDPFELGRIEHRSLDFRADPGDARWSSKGHCLKRALCARPGSGAGANGRHLAKLVARKGRTGLIAMERRRRPDVAGGPVAVARLEEMGGASDRDIERHGLVRPHGRIDGRAGSAKRDARSGGNRRSRSELGQWHVDRQRLRLGDRPVLCAAGRHAEGRAQPHCAQHLQRLGPRRIVRPGRQDRAQARRRDAHPDGRRLALCPAPHPPARAASRTLVFDRRQERHVQCYDCPARALRD